MIHIVGASISTGRQIHEHAFGSRSSAMNESDNIRLDPEEDEPAAQRRPDQVDVETEEAQPCGQRAKKRIRRRKSHHPKKLEQADDVTDV